MREKKVSRKALLVFILLAVAAVPLSIAGIGWAQETDQNESPNSAAMREPGRNEPADLIITDPEADVAQVIRDELGVVSNGSIVVPASALTVDGTHNTWFFPFSSGNIYPTGANNYCGAAPVYLPNGATITAMVAYVYDNDASQFVGVWLYSKPYKSLSSGSNIAGVSTTTDSTSIQALVDDSIGTTGNPVDYSTYTYHVGTCLWSTSSAHQFHSVEIFYTQ